MARNFNLKIFHKIIVILIITIIPYLILSYIFVKEISDERKTLKSQEKNISIMQNISIFTNNIQKERGLVFSYLNGAQNHETVKEQMKKNDELATKLKEEIKEKVILEAIEKINKTRELIEKEEPLTIFLSYTDIIEQLLNYVVYITNQKTTRGIGKLLSTIGFLEEGLEGLAKFRGISSGVLVKDKSIRQEEIKIIIESYSKFSGIILNSKNLLLSPENTKKIKEIEKSEEIEKIITVYNTILEKKSQGNFNISHKENFDNITKIIDSIQQIIDRELDHIYKKNMDFIKSAESNIIINILLLIFTLLLSITLSYFIAKSITKPLKLISLNLDNISKGEGDLTVKIKVSSKDESGIISKTFNEFVEKLRVMVENIKKQAKILVGVSGELAINTQETSTNLSEVVSNSKTLLSNVKNGRDSIINSIRMISEIIDEIKKIDNITEEMKNQLSNVSSAIEEMAANISSSSNMASKAAASSENLEKVSLEGKNSIEKLNISIKDVSENSENIVEMLKLIMDIAEQTNLLAMNAAIEAAHAGEYGKGFAVVAEEIRKLADKSSKSAKDIQNIVKTISENIKKTLDLSDKANQGFLLLGQEISKVKQINYEIASAMEEQKTANNSILKATTELSRISDIIFEKVKEEVNKGNNLTKTLESISVVTNEITDSVEEQKNAIEDTLKAIENIKNISKELKEIAIKINEDFNRFKTE